MNAKDVAKKVLNKNKIPFCPRKIQDQFLCEKMEKHGYLQKIITNPDRHIYRAEPEFIPTFKLYRKFGR